MLLLFAPVVFLVLGAFLLVVFLRLAKGFFVGGGKFCKAEVGMSLEALSSWFKLTSKLSMKA